MRAREENDVGRQTGELNTAGEYLKGYTACDGKSELMHQAE
jgi:hypothetical protein